MKESVSKPDMNKKEDRGEERLMWGLKKKVFMYFAVPIIFLEIVYGIMHHVFGIIFVILNVTLIVMAVVRFEKKKSHKKTAVGESVEKESNSEEKEKGVECLHLDKEYPDSIDGTWMLKYEYKELKIKSSYVTDGEHLVVGQPITFNIEEIESEDGYRDLYFVLSQFECAFAKIPVLKDRVAAMAKNYIEKKDWMIQGNLSTIDEEKLYYHIVFYEEVSAGEILKAKTTGTVIKLESILDEVTIKTGMKVRATTLFGGGQMLVTDLRDNRIGFIGEEDTQRIVDAENGRQITGVIEQVVINGLGGLVTVRFNIELE